MSTIRKIGPKLILCGFFSGLFLVGWASRSSIAQGRAQDAADAGAGPFGRPAQGSTTTGETRNRRGGPCLGVAGFC